MQPSLIEKVCAWYRRFFSIREIEETPMLQWLFGVMLFFFFVTFEHWLSLPTTTVEAAHNAGAVCWPYFQSCSKLYFLKMLPYGYSQTTFYMEIYAIMLLIVWFMWKKNWSAAHALLLLLFLWKAFVVFVLSYTIAGPYDYYHLILTAILLFIPFKEYFSKLMFVFLYFMSVTTKFDPTWTLGTYFTTLRAGLPLLPGSLTTLFTNLVIFMQVIGAWFLLSRNAILQRTVLVFFVIFHLYSGILVGYTYPSIALTALLVLFGPFYRYTAMPASRNALAGWALIVLVALFQVLGFIVPADRRLTLEDNRFGMFMFEANHECVATVTTFRAATSTVPALSNLDVPNGQPCDGFFCLVQRTTTRSATGTVQTQRFESGTAWNRCDPYEWYAKLNEECANDPSIERIALTFDHSINGGPFYRIVDVPNICGLTYQPFVHNAWIQIPPQAAVVGYPVENSYHY